MAAVSTASILKHNCINRESAVKGVHMKELPLVRMSLIFSRLWLFSLFGIFAVSLGYDFFHAKNRSEAGGILFLIVGGVTLFFCVRLINAFMDPLPASLDYWLTPALRAPVTDRQKRTLFIMYAFLYVAMMTIVVLIIIGPRFGLSLERIALPLGFGLLAMLLLNYLLSLFGATYMFCKDRKTSNSADKA
jgi:hypothetical protein